MNPDVRNIWKQALGELQVLVSPLTFSTAMMKVRLERINDGIATLSCPTAFWQQQLESKYYNVLKQVIEKHTGEKISLLFEINADLENKPVDDLPLFAIDSPSKDKVTQISETILRRARLRADYTFEMFAVGSTNQMAFAAAQAVASNLGSAYNPLFIWGGVGVGKTHLMQAIAHEVLSQKNNLKVLCCPGEEFTNEIVEAIRSRTTHLFKEKYRSMDLLLLDDVQFLAGKDAAQEEFFHTFNAIQNAGGQIVLTSDRPPSEIAKLADRLRSRFEAGLIVDISNPNFELRTAIILIKSQQNGIRLAMDTAQAIAEKFESAREMEGFLKQIKLKSDQQSIEITTDFIVEQLGIKLKEVRLRLGVRPADILKVTAEEFNVKQSDLKGERRMARIVLPRQVAMFMMITELGLTYESVGEFFGKDHTTVMHGVDKVKDLMGKSPELEEHIMRIKTALK